MLETRTGLALPRAFYERPTIDVARDLLGCVLVHGDRRCRIVETEAYIGREDLACHAAKGRTKRTEPMFGPAGHAYIYLIYGMYHCLNIVTERAEFPAAVLIRAAEPLARGPGVLCRELGLTKAHNGLDLTCAADLWVEGGPRPAEPILATPRIGVDYARDWAHKPWRFLLDGNPWVSRPRAGQ
ncbi:MAG: DNA-3-methyladenine glycosylase [Chloroflexota bacterium]|nr:DNA-3-methyladenine glycosylase [Chloroflexota bacterium]